MTDRTFIRKISRLDVISTGARRRWTLEEKQRIVAESYSGPRLVSATARRNGLLASQLFTWRRLAREGRLAEADETAVFAPAIIRGESPAGSRSSARTAVANPNPNTAAIIGEYPAARAGRTGLRSCIAMAVSST